MNRLLAPAAAGLWIVLALLTGVMWFGAVRVGFPAGTFAIWAATSAVLAVAIVRTRGSSRSRVASAILSVVSAAGSALLLASSIPFVAAMALVLSLAITVLSAVPWPSRVPAAE